MINRRQGMTAAGMLALLAAVAYHWTFAAPAEDKAKESSPATRYAQIQLQLAELTLKRAQELNRKVPETISAPMMAQYAGDVELAKSQLQLVSRVGHADPFEECFMRAELALRAAETRLKRAEKENKAAPGLLPALDLERWRLRAEICRMQVERGRAAAKGSGEGKLQWQLEMLTEGLAKVQTQANLISQNRLSEF